MSAHAQSLLRAGMKWQFRARSVPGDASRYPIGAVRGWWVGEWVGRYPDILDAISRRPPRANVKLKTRVPIYPGFVITTLASAAIGTPAAIPIGMQQLVLTADQVAFIDQAATPAAVPTLDGDALMAMSLTEAKRLAAAEFERRYLVRVMESAGGSVSEGARLSGLDRTNFRRLLQRHGLR